MLGHALPLLLIMLITQSGCATFLHGPTQQVSVTSEPEGALVSIGSVTGLTPLTVSLPRSSTHRVEIRKDGYRPQIVLLERVMSGAVVGSVLAAGPIGWGVDAVTGAQYRLVPERVHVVLSRDEYRESPAPGGVGIPQTQLEELWRAGTITAAEYEEIMRRLVDVPPRPAGPTAEPVAPDADTAPLSAPPPSGLAASEPASRPAASGPGGSGPAAPGRAAAAHNVPALAETTASPRFVTPGVASAWLLGLWATEGPEQRTDHERMRIEFRTDQAVITWQSTGHHPAEPGSTADALGNVVELTESWVELVGIDATGRHVKYYLMRTGAMLRGYGFLAGSALPVATALTRIR
jgi:hypothetical protein